MCLADELSARVGPRLRVDVSGKRRNDKEAAGRGRETGELSRISRVGRERGEG